MDGVECGEDVKNITDCSTRLMSNNCDHYDDIWLQCNTGEKAEGQGLRWSVENLIMFTCKVISY